MNFSSLLKQFLEMSRQRQIALGGAVVGLLAALFLGLGSVSRPDYAPLYQNLTLSNAGTIEATLAGAGFDVQTAADGTSVSIPREDHARARMVLAESGVPIDGDMGWELFDQQNGLAMNTFMQKVNRLRALEGELARSVQTLEGVQSARVHLVIPEREPFSRDVPTPRASVIVRAAPGRTVSRKQAISIRNLIASSVAELDLNRVTVLSTTGETILAETNEGDSQVTMQTRKTAIEDRLAREIQDILTARVGAGNARVRVNAELTTTREVIVENSYNPDQQVVRSTENTTESQSGTEGAGNVGVENNLPAALGGGEDGATSRRSSSEETVTYEIGNTRREIIKEAGELRRLSVAVLVNGVYTVDGSDVAYSERETEELTRLSELVKSAVGFDAGRGDLVSVDSMRFMDYSMEVSEPVSLSPMQQIARNIVPIIRGLLALAIVGLIVIFGVRPLLRQMSEPSEASDPVALPAEGAESEAGLIEGAVTPITGDMAVSPDSTLEAVPEASTVGGSDERQPEPQFVTTTGIKGELLKSKVEHLQSMAEEQPEQVVRVLKSWLLNEANA